MILQKAAKGAEGLERKLLHLEGDAMEVCLTVIRRLHKLCQRPDGLVGAEADIIAIEKIFGALRAEDRIRPHQAGDGGVVRERHDVENHILGEPESVLRHHLDETGDQPPATVRR